jgi:hypothetical protein
MSADGSGAPLQLQLPAAMSLRADAGHCPENGDHKEPACTHLQLGSVKLEVRALLF